MFFHLLFSLLHFKVLTFSCKCVIMAKDVTGIHLKCVKKRIKKVLFFSSDM